MYPTESRIKDKLDLKNKKSYFIICRKFVSKGQQSPIDVELELAIVISYKPRGL